MSGRSHGEGTIYQRKDGRWQGALQVDGKHRTVYGKSEREVRAKLRELQRDVENTGGLPVSGHHTLNELLDAWVANAPNLKPSTIAKNRWFLDTCVRPTLGDLRLDKVTPDRLQALYSELTPAMAEKVHRLLHRAFAVAVLWRWLPANPCDWVLKPAYKSPQKTLWNHAELDAFLENSVDHWLYPLWVVLIGTRLSTWGSARPRLG
jgi:integrase